MSHERPRITRLNCNKGSMPTKEELEQHILEGVSRAITSQENIQKILDSRHRIKLIKTIDAEYMNDMIFKKFAMSMEKREGIQTDVRVVL